MTYRTTRPAAAAVALAMAVLLTGCSSDDSTDGEAIEGLDTDAEGGSDQNADAEPEPEPDPTDQPEEDGIDRPEIVLPDDMVNTFEDTETGDPVKDTMLADFQRHMNSVDMAVSLSNPYHEAMQFYAYGDALIEAETYVSSAANSGAKGRTWVGTVLYYSFEVTVPERGDASVAFCIDRSGAQTKDLETGEILTAEEGSQHVGTQQAGRVWLRESPTHPEVWQVAGVDTPDKKDDAKCLR